MARTPTRKPSANSKPRQPRPLGNRARELVEDAQDSIKAAQKRMATIDRQAERVDELGIDADKALDMGNVPLARAILLNMRAHAANVRRHEQDAAAALATAQATLGRCVRGEWE